METKERRSELVTFREWLKGECVSERRALAIARDEFEAKAKLHRAQMLLDRVEAWLVEPGLTRADVYVQFLELKSSMERVSIRGEAVGGEH